MNILIVEDNELIRDGLEYYLKNEGFKVMSFAKIGSLGEEVHDFDLAILDISLPDGSGFDLCKMIKEKYGKPVIFLTARDSEVDVETGLTLADDYIIKPFRNRELLLRINNILERNNIKEIIKFKNMEVDTKKCEVKEDGKVINFTSLEYKLFLILIKNKNRILETEYLLDYIYDLTGNFVETNTLRVYIKRIREKMNNDIITTIKGVGYRIDED